MAGIQRDLGLQSVRVGKDDLLAVLRTNLEKHVSEYDAALVGFKEDVKVQLATLLKDVEDGKRIRTTISFDEPQNHRDDYETVIQMLEMSVDTHIDLTMNEFKQYVQDKWSWKDKFSMTNAKYVNF